MSWTVLELPHAFQPGVFSRHLLIMLGADPVLKGPYASHSRALIGDGSRYKTLQAVEEALIAALSQRLPFLLKKYVVVHRTTFFPDDVACVLPIVVRMAARARRFWLRDKM
jgi:hypothetical protein